MTKKRIEFNGIILVNVDEDVFIDEFLDWVISKDWFYTGVINTQDESLSRPD